MGRVRSGKAQHQAGDGNDAVVRAQDCGTEPAKSFGQVSFYVTWAHFNIWAGSGYGRQHALVVLGPCAAMVLLVNCLLLGESSCYHFFSCEVIGLP